MSRRKAYGVIIRGLMYLAAGLTTALVLFMVGYVLINGIPNIKW